MNYKTNERSLSNVNAVRLVEDQSLLEKLIHAVKRQVQRIGQPTSRTAKKPVFIDSRFFFPHSVYRKQTLVEIEDIF
jgi:hypothetical protein